MLSGQILSLGAGGPHLPPSLQLSPVLLNYNRGVRHFSRFSRSGLSPRGLAHPFSEHALIEAAPSSRSLREPALSLPKGWAREVPDIFPDSSSPQHGCVASHWFPQARRVAHICEPYSSITTGGCATSRGFREVASRLGGLAHPFGGHTLTEAAPSSRSLRGWAFDHRAFAVHHPHRHDPVPCITDTTLEAE